MGAHDDTAMIEQLRKKLQGEKLYEFPLMVDYLADLVHTTPVSVEGFCAYYELKFKREVPRPTFASRSKPLHSLCGFLPYSELCSRLEEVKNVLPYLKPEFIDEIAEFYDPKEEYEAA